MASDLVIASSYRPFAKQQEFHRSNKRFKIAAAGNRGGKTLSGAAEFVANIYRDLKAGKGKQSARLGNTRVPRLAYWVITPTHELGEFPYRELVRFIPRELFDGNPNAATREFWLRGDIQVAFRSTERPERLVAASLNGLWMDEGPRCKAEAWRGGLRARLADQEGWAIITGSPLGGRNNWVWQELVSKVGIDEHVAAFHWTTADNPFIPRSEIDHAERTLPAAWFQRDWCASWDSFGGAIYEEFDESVHVTTEEAWRFEHGLGNRPLSHCFNRVVSAIDFGHVAPGCMLTVGEFGDSSWVVLDEVYGPGIRPISGSSRTWLNECRRVQREYGVRDFIGDPEDAGSMFDLRNNGIAIRPSSKQVYMGIRRVATALHPNTEVAGHPRAGLRIFDRCKNMIREMRNYMWKPNREQTGFLEEPAPNQDDHAMDALRYAAMELRYYDYVERQRSGDNSMSGRTG